MKIKDIIIELQKYDIEKELVIFAEGKLYPSLAVQEFDDTIEIGCGWMNIYDDV